MLHETLDIHYWQHHFSVTQMRERGEQPNDFNITGPRSIAVMEQFRDATFANLSEIQRLPTDLFVWNRGEPKQRFVTKIGGLPYRVTGEPWPVSSSGVPLNFVAQFCFADSQDLVPHLPGDLLLIFMEGKAHRSGMYAFMWGYGDERDSSIVFEWVSLEEKPLVTRDEIPATPWRILPCYGTLYRTWDYPDADGFAYPAVAEHVAEILEATKIGGASPSPWMDQHELGTYLCTLNSVFSADGPYPLLNVPEPLPVEVWREEGPLTIGDMGLLNIFMDVDNTIRWIAPI